MTDNTDFQWILDIILGSFAIVCIVVFLVLLVSPIIVLPLYISVFRANRERDRELLTSDGRKRIFPKYGKRKRKRKGEFFPRKTETESLIFFPRKRKRKKISKNRSENGKRKRKFLPSLLLTQIFSRIIHIYPFTRIIRVTNGIIVILVFHLVYTHHILLSVLSIQRFLLYFFSNFERFFSFNDKTTRRVIYGLHISCLVPLLVVYGIKFDESAKNFDLLNTMEMSMRVFSTVLNPMILISSFLYIPIYISIFRFRHLPSFKKQKPHNYILYQTILTVILKATQVAFIGVIQWAEYYDDTVAMEATLFDAIISPLLIQISYLFCNRRNVKAIREGMTFNYLWSKIKYEHRGNRVGVAGHSTTN
ncbi:Protein CBG01426 [Caenorhabditis briggsae]|uniref:Protein CBG01426 n=2 Tax=Caenorhabditis briggsae TaxID=6238 RepID=A8WQE1_CAEBR|nr:Protein CBG01426 [Caenorhabditis briggsae]CAP22699.2 Protein CBG01426 [Caenorhabditis briggsae]